ncbi:MAG TPA: hypothetical protein PKG80_02505, partial [Acidobacteriota bacterium]|nr:hypothetical protein [Acidobacteriota bacterium]
EYAMTPVNRVVYPNRILRAANLLKIHPEAGREYLDLPGSAAFASLIAFTCTAISCSRIRRLMSSFKTVPSVVRVPVRLVGPPGLEPGTS